MVRMGWKLWPEAQSRSVTSRRVNSTSQSGSGAGMMTSHASSAGGGILLLQLANQFPGIGLGPGHAAPAGDDIAVVAEPDPAAGGADADPGRGRAAGAGGRSGQGQGQGDRAGGPGARQAGGPGSVPDRGPDRQGAGTTARPGPRLQCHAERSRPRRPDPPAQQVLDDSWGTWHGREASGATARPGRHLPSRGRWPTDHQLPDKRHTRSVGHLEPKEPTHATWTNPDPPLGGG